MSNQRTRGLHPIVERSFGWLRALGFDASLDADMTVGATFATSSVVVRATYHWHDQYADVTIARRWLPEPGPYWAQVHLGELLERAPGLKRAYNGAVPSEQLLEEVFATAAGLLREVAAEQLAGRNLELLDQIVAERPRRGVAGLDFPAAEPWAASQEGLWFTTDFVGSPPSIAESIVATHATDATARATAALRLNPGIAKGRESNAALGRLVKLLDDSDPNVRRAAASSLSEWGDRSVVGRILGLLDGEAGNAASPFAAAATFLAIGESSDLRQEVRDALDRFAIRGQPAREQVAELRWRLDDRPRQYPRVSRVWSPGPD